MSCLQVKQEALSKATKLVSGFCLLLASVGGDHLYHFQNQCKMKIWNLLYKKLSKVSLGNVSRGLPWWLKW